MKDRQYYSVRTGKNVASKPDLRMVCRMFRNVYERSAAEGLFRESFGYRKADGVHVAGKVGPDLHAAVFQRLHKSGLFPVSEKHTGYSEEDLFDIIEFLHDYVSKPLSSWGGPVRMFDKEMGRRAFRNDVNITLADYRDGYELTEAGEILSLGPEEMRPLLGQELPEYDPQNVDQQVKAAVHAFRRHTPSVEDKRQAITELARVLEFLRPKLKGVLPSRDEGDLFNIANNFGIRHHNPKQKADYDEKIWLDWIFYCYLNTIHTTIALLKREGIEYGPAG